MTIAGVLRDEIFSPNSNDLRIMQLVSENLQGQGRTILLYTEKEFLRNDIHAHIVFSMARHTATLDKLQVLESPGNFGRQSSCGSQTLPSHRNYTGPAQAGSERSPQCVF